MKYSFNNHRYIAKGVNENIPFIIQLLLWEMITNMNVTDRDYLQVFKLKIIDKQKKIIEIIHSQEIPKYKNRIAITSELDDDMTIFCIDDITHSTMLLSNEY